MRVNSVNNVNNYSYNSKQPSFKHTAVPYPEYLSAYSPKTVNLQDRISGVVNKIVALFQPEVTKQASEIKSQIDAIYDNQSAKKYLVSVLA